MPDAVNKLTPHTDGARRRMFMKGLTNVAILPGGRGANPEANVTFYKSAEKQEKRPGETDAQFRARMRREEADKQERRRRRRRGDKDYSKQEGSPQGDTEKANGDVVDMVTSVNEGHQHGISVYMYDGELSLMTSFAGMDRDSNHDHQLVQNDDGSYSVLENFGHSHDDIPAEALVQMIGQRLLDKEAAGDEMPDEGPLASLLKMAKEGEIELEPGGDTMPNDTKELDALKAQVASLTAVAALSGVHKTHYDSLDDDGKADFLKVDAAARDALIEAAKAAKADADPVVYKCEATGEEFRKSDDPRLVNMAKTMDADRKEAIRLQKKSADDDLTKRAESDLAHFPGDVAVRKSILKAVDGIKDEETRKAAHDALKAKDASLAPAFTTVGAGGQPAIKADTQTEAENELDTLAKARAAKDNTDFYTAYEKVSEENPELLAKAMG